MNWNSSQYIFVWLSLPVTGPKINNWNEYLTRVLKKISNSRGCLGLVVDVNLTLMIVDPRADLRNSAINNVLHCQSCAAHTILWKIAWKTVFTHCISCAGSLEKDTILGFITQEPSYQWKFMIYKAGILSEDINKKLEVTLVD